VTLMLSNCKEPFVCLAKHRQLVQPLIETVESLKGEILQLKSSKLPRNLDMPVSGEEPNQKTKSVSYKVPSQVAEQSGQAAEQLPLSLPVKEATLHEGCC